jgi:hypothetical protein
MENPAAFNIVVTIAGFLAGWVLNNITRNLNSAEIASFPLVYVTKDEYRRDIDELKDICKQIFAKLDNKADE